MAGSTQRGSLLAEGDDGCIPLTLTVNEAYAARLQHNKEREAWHRMKEKNPELAASIEASTGGRERGAEDSEDSTSDDDDEEVGGTLDDDEQLRFLSVLSRIKQRDNTIYDPGTKLFMDEEDDDAEEGEEASAGGSGKSRKERQTRLKDVLASQALAGEAGTSDDEDAQPPGGAAGPTYVEEQEQYRQAFLKEVEKEDVVDHGSDAFGNILRKKRQVLPELSEGPQARQSERHTQALLDAYFGEDSALPEDEQFLKNYISKKGWVDRGDELGSLDAAEDGIDDDEQYLEAADKFEAQYNHRFEEPGAANVITYPRNLEGIVRKKDDRRKAQRESRAQRKAAEAAALEETVKRLKTHKRREVQERLARIKEVSGNAAAERMLADVLGKADLDLDEYDKAMAAAFDDSYYQADDEELGSPDADAGSDDNDVVPIQQLPDLDEAGEEGAAVWAQVDDGPTKADLAQLMDDYHKLDAEDYVGGVACRFRYREVPPTSYGLSILDVLRLPDKDLNQVVGMKRLAPYREDGGATRPNYGKLRELQVADPHLPRKKSKVAKPRAVTLQLEEESLGRGVTHTKDVAPSTAGHESQPEPPATAAPSVKAGGPAKKRKTREVEQHTAATDTAEGVQQGSKRPKKDMKQKEAKGKPAGAVGDEPGAASAAKKMESRMASFAKPTLNKPNRPTKGKMSKAKPSPSAADKAGAGSTAAADQHLTKAQKKNLWRQKRRASLRETPG